jgi:hypothetical protein
MSSCAAGESRAPRRETNASVSCSGSANGCQPSASGTCPSSASRMPRETTVSAWASPAKREGRLEVLDLHLGDERATGALGGLVELAAGRVLAAEGGVGEDERPRGEALHGDRPLQGVRVGGAEDELVLHDRPHVEAPVVDRQRDHPRLEVAVADVVGDLRGVLADEPDPHPRVARPELRDDRRAGVEARAAPGPERDDALAQLALGGDGLARRGDRREDRLGVRAQRPPGLRRDDPAADPLEEPHAELGLEPADLLGDARLREQQLVGRSAERAEPQRGQEVLELLERHRRVG